MIEREKLEKLAKVMGGQVLTVDGYSGTVWGEYAVDEDGKWNPGTLESLYAKLDEWANGEEGCTFTRTLINGSYELCLYAYSWKQVNFEGSELSTLIDAVLWIAEQEQEQGGQA